MKTEGFRVNSPHVMHETIEGEVILIHLETGSYYSLRDTGAAIWQALEGGADKGQIVEALALRYEGSREDVQHGVDQLLLELAAEGLVEPIDGPGNPAVDFSNGTHSREPFHRPVLEKHTDMQDLILLDPVHEVDARGWPHAAPSGPGRA